MEQLIFSLNICRSVKSNAIVICQNNKTIGIGSGQPSRLDSCKIAIQKMDRYSETSDYADRVIRIIKELKSL